jgi:hypothetical protein
MGLSLFQRLFLISTPFMALSSLAQTLDRDQLLSRDVWLFQNSPAELQDRYGATQGNFQITDLPGQVTPGSCDFPGLTLSRVDYPRDGLDWVRGQRVDLWLRDASLGNPFQSATVAWREPPRYGLTLESGRTLSWQPGDDWAQVLTGPTPFLGLSIQADSSDAVVLRCSVPGPAWRANYQAVQRGDTLDLALDALIQVPAGQQWGLTNVTLSSQVGRGPQPRAMRAELMAASADVNGESMSDGIWRYRLEQPLQLGGGEQFTQRLWRESVPIERVHRLRAFLSARNNQAEQDLRASREWLMKNTTDRAMPAGALRINGVEGDRYPPAGQVFVPDLAVGAQHRLQLGPSLAVSARLTRLDQDVTQSHVHSNWRVNITNGGEESVTVALNLQGSPRSELPGSRQTVQLAAGEERTLTLRLSEPR